jgi:hypothetical protein
MAAVAILAATCRGQLVIHVHGQPNSGFIGADCIGPSRLLHAECARTLRPSTVNTHESTHGVYMSLAVTTICMLLCRGVQAHVCMLVRCGSGYFVPTLPGVWLPLRMLVLHRLVGMGVADLPVHMAGGPLG